MDTTPANPEPSSAAAAPAEQAPAARPRRRTAAEETGTLRIVSGLRSERAEGDRARLAALMDPSRH